MSQVLIADTPEGIVSIERILKGHQCTVVHTMTAAEKDLKTQAFDLIVVALHFDDSRMFDLLREVRKSSKNAGKPVICFCSRLTPLSRLMHESLETSTRVLGAWMYLDEHAYNVYRDPDAELRRIIERCLTEESRKEIQQQRLDVHRQRGELQQLRVLLQSQEWSPQMKDYLSGLKHDLELLLKEVGRLNSEAGVQRASIAASRDLKDRVAEHVTSDENSMTSREELQLAAEARQTAGEDELTAKETRMEKDAQSERRDGHQKD